MLKVACSGPGMSRTRNLSVTSPIFNQYTTAGSGILSNSAIFAKLERLLTQISKARSCAILRFVIR